MQLILRLFLTVTLAVSCLSAEVSPEKGAEIRKILEVTGTMKLMASIKTDMMAEFRTSIPGVPQKFWNELERELDVEEIVKLVVSVWDKHLSLEDLKAINAFYATPAGKRLAEKTPIMTAETTQAAQKWGEAKAKVVIERLKQKGLVK